MKRLQLIFHQLVLRLTDSYKLISFKQINNQSICFRCFRILKNTCPNHMSSFDYSNYVLKIVFGVYRMLTTVKSIVNSRVNLEPYTRLQLSKYPF